MNFNVLTQAVMKKFPPGRQFSSAAVIAVTKEYPMGYLVMQSQDTTDNKAIKVNLLKKGKRSLNLSAVSLPLMYARERKLDQNKLQDLEDLSRFMGDLEGKWLKDLIARQKQLHDVEQPFSTFPLSLTPSALCISPFSPIQKIHNHHKVTEKQEGTSIIYPRLWNFFYPLGVNLPLVENLCSK